MERKSLEPAQILLPGGLNLGNEDVFKIYFRIFDRGNGCDLPPPIVIKKDLINENAFRNFVDQDRARAFYSQIEQSEGTYLLIDGNHKISAAILCHVMPSVLELQTDKDLIEVNSMIERGELFNFPHHQTNLSTIANNFFNYAFQANYAKTLQQSVDELVSAGDLPQYMKEKYYKNT